MKKFFIVLAALFFMTRMSAVTPSPYTEAVTFSTKLTPYSSSGQPITCSGTVTLTVAGEGTAGTVNSSWNGAESSTVGTAWLRPAKEYTATLSGAMQGSGVDHGDCWISFTTPNGYALYLDGIPLDLKTESLPGTSAPSYYSPVSKSFKIELRPLADGAPAGAGIFSGIHLGKSVSWEVGLGGLRTGRSAGEIYFKEKDLTTSPASRDRLYYSAPANYGQINVVKDGASNQTLRQISTPQTVVDLVDVSGDGYWMKFYAPAQATWTGSIYTFTGQTPWRTIRVQAPSSTQFKVTETEGAFSLVSQLTLTSGTVASGVYLWTLEEGNGSTWLRTTTRNSTIPTTDERDEVVTVCTGGTGGTVVAKTKYHYATQSWGAEELTQVIADPDTAQLTTTYVYHSVATQYGNYRKVKYVTDATGNWTSYSYYDDWNRRGRLAVETHPLVDTPATAQAASTSVGNSISYDYAADSTGRYTIESSRQSYSGGVQTGKRVTTPTINLMRGSTKFIRYQSDDYSASGSSLSTISEIIDPTGPDGDFVGQPYSIKRPDQSQDTFIQFRGTYSGTSFSPGTSGDHYQTIVWHGSTNATGATAYSTYALNLATVTTINLIANKSTMDVVIRNPAGLVLRQESYVYTGGTSFSLLSFQDFTYDGAGRLTQSVASNGATISNGYVNGLLDSSTDASGTEIRYAYDLLGRVASQRKVGAAASGSYAAQGDIHSYFTYDGSNRVVESVTTNASSKPTLPGGALDLFSTSTYDLAGRVTQQVANAGASNTTNRLTTGFAYNAAARTATATLPGGATKISTANLDGSLQSVTGTGVISEFLTYSVDSSSGNRKTQRQDVSTSEPVLGATTQDWLGRTISLVSPGWNGGTMTQTSYYNSLGQLSKVSSPGLADTLYAYDTLGGLVQQGLDVSGDGSITAASSDRISERGWTIFTTGGNWWRRDTSTTYATAGSGTATQLGKTETQLSGLPANRLSYAQSTDIFGNVTTAYTEVNRTGKLVTSTTDTPDSTTNAVQIAYNGLLMSAQDTVGVTMKYGYDALGRTTQSIDPRTGTSTTAYLAGTNLVDWIKDPANVAQATYTYDSAGRVATVADGLGKLARYDYNNRSQKLHEWGETVYPVEYVYDSYGRQTHLKTFAGATATTATTWAALSLGTAAWTFWDYETATGLLKAKYDAANLNGSGVPITSPTKVAYTYTTAGQPATKTNQRGIVTTYGYSSTTGELTGVGYSDSTPSLSYTYNRLGQTATVGDSTIGTRTFNYNLTGTLELQSEDLPASYYTNRRLTSTYATTGVVGRPTGLQLGTSSTPAADQAVAYTYQGDGRLGTIAGGGQTFTYGYLGDSHLISTVSNTALNFTDTRTYNGSHDWTASRETTWGATPVSKAKFAYNQDGLGRITDVTKTGEIFNRYGNGIQGLKAAFTYDDRSQLTGDQTKLAGTGAQPIITGRDDSFAFDSLGNRTTVTHRTISNNTPVTNTSTYTLKTNGLNQYSQRAVPGYFDVAGAAPAPAPDSVVTISRSGGSPDVTARSGDYFFDAFPMSNSGSTAAWAGLLVDNISQVGSGGLDTVATSWSIAAVADFNANGQTDILWQNAVTGDRYVWLMNGINIISSVFIDTVDPVWSIAAAADFNGDGKPDILWQNAVTGDRYVWLMNGTSFVSSVFIDTVDPVWSIAAAADFNGDGKPDILWQNAVTGDRYVWLMNGTGFGSSVSIGNVAVAWSIAAAADFNGDGQPDILWRNTTSGVLRFWFMNGLALVSMQDLPAVATDWTMAGSGDFNADGKPDIVWSNTSTGERKVWFMSGSTATVAAFVAKTPETFTYDDDGNLLTDGRWSNTYDAENRLIAQETLAIAYNAGVTRQKLTYQYDYLGRRVGKRLYSWNLSLGAWNLDYEHRFIYNGWTQIAEFDVAGSTLTLLCSSFWGLDLSGTGQGAGGVGGLLLTKEAGNSYLPAYDGMGNVHAMIKASDGSIAAAYEYDAFGNTLRESGPYAAGNPFRSATKYTDTETSLVYYGHRYYSPSLGRFINRDPIEESGGVNLYGFCGNNGVNRFDYLGMADEAPDDSKRNDKGGETEEQRKAREKREQEKREQDKRDAERGSVGAADAFQLLYSGYSPGQVTAALGGPNQKAHDVAFGLLQYVGGTPMSERSAGLFNGSIFNCGGRVTLGDLLIMGVVDEDTRSSSAPNNELGGAGSITDAPAQSAKNGLLSWSDFQGKAPKGKTGEDAYYAYRVFGEIKTWQEIQTGKGWTAKLTGYVAGAEMDKSASWVRPSIIAKGGNAALYLLKHETGHDRIVQMGGQSLFNDLSGLSVQGATREAARGALFQRFNDSVNYWTNSIQQQTTIYDNLTSHGTNTRSQDSYNKGWGF